MADYFTHFSCLLDVGSPDKAARALALFQELREADQDADVLEVAGFDIVRQDAPEGSTLWIHDDEHGDVEAVIRFVLRLAEELDLTGLWGFQYALCRIRHKAYYAAWPSNRREASSCDMTRPTKDYWVRLTNFVVLNPQLRAKAFGIILVAPATWRKPMAKKIQPTCLDPYFSSFEESLAPTHMQRRALSNYRFQLRRFGRVLEAEGVEPTSLTLELADHLARQVPFDRMNAVRIPNLVRRFVLHLISIGVAIPPPVSSAQIAKDKLLDDLETFLLGQRGLSPSSVYQVRRYAVRFLNHRFGDMVPDPSAIRHHDIVAFLEHVQKGKSLSMARTPASHLRCFFQYLFARGLTASNLSSAVPKLHRTYSTRLPRYLPPTDIEAILEWVRRESSYGVRDYAMFLLMARLGLRVPEVMAIEIDDIDWRAGELLVRGKGKRRDRLPLPEDVGAAISAYLRDARPSTVTRVLFVRSYAPYLGFKDSRIISKILSRACAAMKIEMPARYLGSHVLRHSLATRMVRTGVSLHEVGDVLRHKSRATTMIYAKLDIANLRSVAQPWPAGEAQQ